MVNPQIVRGWIKKADEDFQYAKTSLKQGLEFYPQICFHLQQAAEKYLKAYIVAKELEFQKVHDLTRLVQICSEQDPEFNEILSPAQKLNPFYIETRYPDFLAVISKETAQESLKLAEEIAVHVKEKLSVD